jgi:hypothetical protein
MRTIVEFIKRPSRLLNWYIRLTRRNAKLIHSSDTQKCYFIDCVLNETPMRTYIATGCNVITIRKTAAAELQLSVHPKSHSNRGQETASSRAQQTEYSKQPAAEYSKQPAAEYSKQPAAKYRILHTSRPYTPTSTKSNLSAWPFARGVRWRYSVPRCP